MRCSQSTNKLCEDREMRDHDIVAFIKVLRQTRAEYATHFITRATTHVRNRHGTYGTTRHGTEQKPLNKNARLQHATINESIYVCMYT